MTSEETTGEHNSSPDIHASRPDEQAREAGAEQEESPRGDAQASGQTEEDLKAWQKKPDCFVCHSKESHSRTYMDRPLCEGCWNCLRDFIFGSLKNWMDEWSRQQEHSHDEEVADQDQS